MFASLRLPERTRRDPSHARKRAHVSMCPRLCASTGTCAHRGTEAAAMASRRASAWAWVMPPCSSLRRPAAALPPASRSARDAPTSGAAAAAVAAPCFAASCSAAALAAISAGVGGGPGSRTPVGYTAARGRADGGAAPGWPPARGVRGGMGAGRVALAPASEARASMAGPKHNALTRPFLGCGKGSLHAECSVLGGAMSGQAEHEGAPSMLETVLPAHAAQA
jgi:hypothetical protein